MDMYKLNDIITGATETHKNKDVTINKTILIKYLTKENVGNWELLPGDKGLLTYFITLETIPLLIEKYNESKSPTEKLDKNLILNWIEKRAVSDSEIAKTNVNNDKQVEVREEQKQDQSNDLILELIKEIKELRQNDNQTIAELAKTNKELTDKIDDKNKKIEKLAETTKYFNILQGKLPAGSNSVDDIVNAIEENAKMRVEINELKNKINEKKWFQFWK